MSCQYPNCSLPRHSICSNHCHWSLCSKHLDQHQESLVNEFQQILEDLTEPMNAFSKSIEQIKQTIKDDQEKELNQLKQSHENQIEKFERRSLPINQLQNRYNQISEHLSKIKTNEDFLTQDDFQQIDILLQEINQYKNSLHDVNLPQEQTELIYCPLTSYNIYGLSSSHNLRLCTARRRTRNLFEHLRNYHHLTIHYANELVNAITHNFDPKQTKIFPPNDKITDIDEKQACPLHDVSKESGIICTPCPNVVTDKFLPIHLKTVHRLRLSQIHEILKGKNMNVKDELF